MGTFRDEALLLRRTAYGESSLVVHVLTPGHGRVHMLAKGAYRPTSRFFCVLDLFDTLELEWKTKPGRELDLLSRGDRSRRRRQLTTSSARYRSALAMLELAELAAQPGQADRPLYSALVRGLDRLEAAGEEAAETTLEPARFEADYLAATGLAPALVTCASCAEPAPPLPAETRQGEPRVAFSAGVGGRLCHACATQARAAGRRVGTLPLRVVEAAAMLARGETWAGDDPTLPERVRDLFERFLAYHLERPPRILRATLEGRSPGSSATGERPSLPSRS